MYQIKDHQVYKLVVMKFSLSIQT